MCGIIGWIGGNTEYTNNKSLFIKALDGLSKRGPDNQSYCCEKNWILGHARLSIIDLSSFSNQPFTDGNGNFLVFNGEIYNFQQLKKELEQQGIFFETNGDTEVLLKGLITEGVNFIKKLKGMFAFAWLNTATKKIILCKDRVGVKPLCYTVQNKQLLFASDVFAIETLLQNKLTISDESTALFMMLGYVPSPHTIYKEVKKIKPASYKEFLVNDAYEIIDEKEINYWDVASITAKSSTKKITFEEAYETYKSLIKDSVSFRLVSDVEVGSLLSGGIDSSLVTMQAATLTENKIRCFTQGFTDERYDESPYAREIAENLGLQWHNEYQNEESVLDIWNSYYNIYDEPFADSSALPMAALSQSIRKFFKVALCGDGGDEVNAGYPWHWAMYKMDSFPFSTPHFITKLIDKSNISFGLKYKFRALSCKNRLDKWIFLKTGLLQPEFANLPLGNINGYELLKAYFETYNKQLNSSENTLDWSMKMDILTYLPDDLQFKADRASMYCGLELREPLLDHTLLEFSY